jgi:putative ABC transport system permease protein
MRSPVSGLPWSWPVSSRRSRSLCRSSAFTHELGLRFALGASPQTLLALVLSDGLKLVGVGVVLGLAGAFILARFLETQLFGVTAHDPVTFAAVPLLLIGAAIAGCLIPARRATRIDPMTALRTQ